MEPPPAFEEIVVFEAAYASLEGDYEVAFKTDRPRVQSPDGRCREERRLTTESGSS
jgi:hypothetical protein